MKTRNVRRFLRPVIAGCFVLSGASLHLSAAAPPLTPNAADGLWAGVADLNGEPVPFRLRISGDGKRVQGALLNGSDASHSSSGSYSDGHLILHFDYFANTLDATIRDGTLTGTFGRPEHSVKLTAQRNGAIPSASSDPPNVAGVWRVAVPQGRKGENSWQLRVRQSGSHVDAVIERIDGDTGNLYGVWRKGQFAVSHFTAAGPSWAALRPQHDGTLQVLIAGHGGKLESLTAQRIHSVTAVSVPSQDDPLHHTSLQDPRQPLRFAFPDVQGKIVSSSNPQFRHKVLIVSIGGSWCPNCQDEAPFLESLYRKYHDHGLEIVELSFEEQAQLSNPTRLKAVIRKFGITYPVLLAGTPDQLNARFPGVLNLNCWPTTFFIGKDGLVKEIHTGYEGPATGTDNTRLERETAILVQRLLSGDEKPRLLANRQVSGGQ